MFKAATLTFGILSTLLIGCSSKQKVESNFDNKEIELPKKVAVINFNFDSSKINEPEFYHLNKTLELLSRAPEDFIVLIKGHTDRIGPSEYNQTLGLERAKSVKEALMARGIQENKVQIISYGEEKPIIMTKTWDERSKNRRAIIEIVPADKDSSNTTISMNQ